MPFKNSHDVQTKSEDNKEEEENYKEEEDNYTLNCNFFLFSLIFVFLKLWSTVTARSKYFSLQFRLYDLYCNIIVNHFCAILS